MKKSKTVTERMAAVDARILELQKKRDSKAKDLEERKLDAAKLLASLAEKDDPKVEESLKAAIKGCERLSESLNDLVEQVSLLQGQRDNLAKEFSLAAMREIPARCKAEVEGWHQLMGESLPIVNSLKGLYERMKKHEANLHSQQIEYDEAQRKLGLIEPMNLEKTIPMSLPNFEFFSGIVLAFHQSLKDREAFLKANPNYDKQVEENRRHQAEAETLGFASAAHRFFEQ